MQATACVRCGFQHMHDRCPAKDQECHYCHKIGHFMSVCKSTANNKRVSEVEMYDDNDMYDYAHNDPHINELYIGELQIDSVNKSACSENHCQQTPNPFQIGFRQ